MRAVALTQAVNADPLSYHKERMDFDTFERTEKKKINILLVRYPDKTSTLLRFFTRNTYTHASIGIDGADGKFYSLVTNGFRIEKPYAHQTFKGKDIPCKLYSIDVSPKVYGKIKRLIAEHLQVSKAYKYSYLGVLLCLLRIPIKRKNRYFCSQFVSEVLSCAVNIKKSSALYLPDDFMKLGSLNPQFTGTLKELLSVQNKQMAFS